MKTRRVPVNFREHQTNLVRRVPPLIAAPLPRSDGECDGIPTLSRHHTRALRKKILISVGEQWHSPTLSPSTSPTTILAWKANIVGHTHFGAARRYRISIVAGLWPDIRRNVVPTDKEHTPLQIRQSQHHTEGERGARLPLGRAGEVVLEAQ